MGPAGETGPAGTCTCEIQTFLDWLNQGQLCSPGSKKCDGNTLRTCDNFQWNAGTTCQYGCENNACKSQPKENCLTKPDVFKKCVYNNNYAVVTDYYECKYGHGTSTSCDPGYCASIDSWKYCQKGCDATLKGCKA